MTIIWKTVPIHECTETLIINPMLKFHGAIIGHPLDDFILHYHKEVYRKFAEIQPSFGSVQYVRSKPFIFANAVVGKRYGVDGFELNSWEIIRTLINIRSFAIEEDVLNDIAIALRSYTSVPGSEELIPVLKKIFADDTIVIYTGTRHTPDIC